MTDELRGFFIVLGIDEAANTIYLGKQENAMPANYLSLRDNHTGWIEFYPFDAPEYSAIAWQDVSRNTMERITGATFTDEDFQPHSKTVAIIPFPMTCGISFIDTPILRGFYDLKRQDALNWTTMMISGQVSFGVAHVVFIRSTQTQSGSGGSLSPAKY
jgi:hypothetical protein